MSWREGEDIWTEEDEMRYQCQMDAMKEQGCCDDTDIQADLALLREQEEAAEQAYYEEQYQEYLEKAQKK